MVSIDEVQCAWWDNSLLESSGSWNSAGCELVPSSNPIATSHDADGASKTCRCTDVLNTTVAFGLIAPLNINEPVEEERMSSMFIISMFIKVAAAMFVLVQLGVEGLSKHLRLAMHYFGAVVLTSIVSAVSGLISSEIDTVECQVIGIFCHYFILAQFSWVLSLGAHVFWASVKPAMTFSSPPEYAGMFWRLIGCGWGTPIALMVIAALANVGAEGDQLYGHTTDDKRMCLVPEDQSGMIGGTVGALFALCTLLIGYVATQFMSLSPESRRDWANHVDLFELVGVGRANSFEATICIVVFALMSLDTAVFVAAGYATTGVETWSIISLITAILYVLAILYFYGAYSSLRHLFEKTPAALPPKSLQSDPADGERSAFSSPMPSMVVAPISEVSAGYYQASRPTSPAGPADLPPMRSVSPMSGEVATMAAAVQYSVAETKASVVSDPIQEEEFDDLVYALKADTFEGGGDSSSLAGISRELDPQSRDFALKRISIADTHL